MEGGVLEECEASAEVLLSDTMDQYRTFQMCERLLYSPSKLGNQLLFQIPPHRQAMLIERCAPAAVWYPSTLYLCVCCRLLFLLRGPCAVSWLLKLLQYICTVMSHNTVKIQGLTLQFSSNHFCFQAKVMNHLGYLILVPFLTHHNHIMLEVTIYVSSPLCHYADTTRLMVCLWGRSWVRNSPKEPRKTWMMWVLRRESHWKAADDRWVQIYTWAA